MVKSLVLVSLLSVSAFANDLELNQKLEKGLQSLYSGQLNAEQLRFKVERARATRQEYDRLVQGFDPSTIKWKKIDANEIEFEFPSPIQRPDSKANTVYGYVYSPNVPLGCNFKFPGTLLVHHVDDKISPQQLIGMQTAKMAKGVVMVIVLPEYGKRKNAPIVDPKNPPAPFNGNLQDFRNDLFQSLVDLRVSYQILKSIENVDQNQMLIGGLSLGGALTATLAGFDPVFDRYLIGVGGGDYGAIMTSYNKPGLSAGGAIKWALQNVGHWKTEEVRNALDDMDAFTWSYNIGAKKVHFLSAQDDEIFPLETNVKKLADIYRQSGSDVKVNVHAGMHVPDHKKIGVKTALKVYYAVGKQIFGFLGDSQAAAMDMCASQYR